MSTGPFVGADQFLGDRHPRVSEAGCEAQPTTTEIRHPTLSRRCATSIISWEPSLFEWTNGGNTADDPGENSLESPGGIIEETEGLPTRLKMRSRVLQLLGFATDRSAAGADRSCALCRPTLRQISMNRW